MERLVRFTGLKLIIAVVVIVGSMGLAAQVEAVDFAVDDEFFLGTIVPDGGSPATEAAQINILVGLAPGGTFTDADNTYTRSGETLCSPTCPTATAVGSVGEELPGQNNPNATGDNAGSLDPGFDYLKGKYGNSAFVWYVAGLDGDFTLPSSIEGEGGLSHWLLFNPNGTSVAEPSTTLLAGLAFAGIAFFGRKFLPKA